MAEPLADVALPQGAQEVPPEPPPQESPEIGPIVPPPSPGKNIPTDERLTATGPEGPVGPPPAPQLPTGAVEVDPDKLTTGAPALPDGATEVSTAELAKIEHEGNAKEATEWLKRADAGEIKVTPAEYEKMQLTAQAGKSNLHRMWDKIHSIGPSAWKWLNTPISEMLPKDALKKVDLSDKRISDEAMKQAEQDVASGKAEEQTSPEGAVATVEAAKTAIKAVPPALASAVAEGTSIATSLQHSPLIPGNWQGLEEEIFNAMGGKFADEAQRREAADYAKSGFLKNRIEEASNKYAEKVGLDRNSFIAQVINQLPYFLIPGGEIGMAEAVDSAVANVFRAGDKLKAAVDLGLAKTTARIPKIATTAAFVAAPKAAEALGIHGVSAAMSQFGGAVEMAAAAAGIKFGPKAATGEKFADAIYSKILKMDRGEVVENAKTVLQAPWGEDATKSIQNSLDKKIADLQEEVASQRKRLDPDELYKLDERRGDGRLMWDSETLKGDLKDIRLKEEQISDVIDKSDAIGKQTKFERFSKDADQYLGNVAAHAAIGASAGAGFTGAIAPTGDEDATAQGALFGGALGVLGAPFAAKAGMRANRLKAGANALIGLGRENISAEHLASLNLSPEDAKEVLKFAGAAKALGKKIVTVNPDHPVLYGEKPAAGQKAAMPANGAIKGDTIYLNKDALKEGVAGHEYTHATQEMFGKMLREADPALMEHFETEYGKALGKSGEFEFSPQAERDAEIGRILLQNAPIESFFGGESGGDMLRRIGVSVLGKINPKWFHAYEVDPKLKTPYNRADLEHMRARMFAAGEKQRELAQARGEKVERPDMPEAFVRPQMVKDARKAMQLMNLPGNHDNHIKMAIRRLGRHPTDANELVNEAIAVAHGRPPRVPEAKATPAGKVVNEAMDKLHAERQKPPEVKEAEAKAAEAAAKPPPEKVVKEAMEMREKDWWEESPPPASEEVKSSSQPAPPETEKEWWATPGQDKAYMPKPITKEDVANHPTSRPISEDEFNKLSEIGARALAALKKNASPTDGMNKNWDKIKTNSYEQAQKSWGGVTIDSHTGQPVRPKAEHGPWSLSAKEPGQDTISIPEKATPEEFNAAMDKAKKAFPQLENEGYGLGVFHDDGKKTIDIDPVVVVDNRGDVETIGAHTRAVGGAYDFATGDGYYPPHVDPSLEPTMARTGAGGAWDSTFVSGEGQAEREALAKEVGADAKKHFTEQKPAVQAKIREHYKSTGEAQYMPATAPQSEEFKKWSGGAPVVLSAGPREIPLEEVGLRLKQEGDRYNVVDKNGEVISGGFRTANAAANSLSEHALELSKQQTTAEQASKFKTGEPVVVGAYHGTPSEKFHVFDPNKMGEYTGAPSAAKGFFFAGSPETAKSYARPREIFDIYQGSKDMSQAERNKLWHTMDRLTSVENDKKGLGLVAPTSQTYIGDIHDFIRDNPDIVKQEAEKITGKAFDATPKPPSMHEVYVKFENPMVKDFKGEPYREETYSELLDRAKDHGHDGAIFTNTYDGSQKPDNIFVTFDNKNIKSTENVGTFSPTNPDIRYMPKTHDEAVQYSADKLKEYPESMPVIWQKKKDGTYKTNKKGEYLPTEYDFNFLDSPLAKTAAEGTKSKEGARDAYTTSLGDRLAAEVEKKIHIPEVASAKGWYRVATEKIQKIFGDQTELFARLLGVTSARTGAAVNFRFAVEAMNGLRSGRYDAMLEKFNTDFEAYNKGELKTAKGVPITKPSQFEAYLNAHDIIPRQANGKRLGMNSIPALYVLANRFDLATKGLKVKQFSGNLAGTDMNATIDIWAARLAHRLSQEGLGNQRWRQLPASEPGVKPEDFMVAQEAFGKAAKKLNMNADDLQAILWFAEKHEWNTRSWSKKGAGSEYGDYRSHLDRIEAVPGTQEHRLIEEPKPPKAPRAKKQIEPYEQPFGP